MTKEIYDKIKTYKEVCELFAKCGEYTGGADSLVFVYEREFSTTVDTRCTGCFGAMLLDVNNKIKEYEANILINIADKMRVESFKNAKGERNM